ncbi:MAG: hypothetical protein V2A57_04215 [Elusimicrobiota bacterium]
MEKEKTGKLDPHRCALLIRAALGVKMQKQTEIAKKLGLNRVVLNMFLNRRLNLLDQDILMILTELNVQEKAILEPERVCLS